MRNVFRTALIATVVIFAACNNPSTTDNAATTRDSASHDDDESVKAYIRKEASNWGEEVRRGDSTAMAAHYASDAMVMPSNSEPVKGNDILKFWGSVVRMGVKDLKLNITDISGAGDVYAETGTLELFGADNKSLDKGKYVVVWKKENGHWKMYRDIWNSNLPAPGSK
jgi:ketosteroid isomerase-like protein